MDHALSKPELRQQKLGRAEFVAQPRTPITVVLDQVTGGYNIGAMFRLCDAFLVERLIVCGEEVSLRRRSTSQAAMGAQHWVPWQQEADAAAVVRAAKAAGSWVLAVEITAASVRLAALRPRFPLVLVLAASGPACRRAC